MNPAIKEPQQKLAIVSRIAAAVLLFWTAALAVLLAWAVTKEKRQVLTYARMEAKANFNKDIALRNWAAKRGGVYVPVSDATPPNPYLAHVPERDIETPSGRPLTLMNPAYMLRQIMQEFSGLYGIEGRVTSLNPLNPINTPDPWEVSVLRQFEQGTNEAAEVTDIDGRPYLRYMQAFYVEEGCLKCHWQQGYVKGDVRGGIGVSVPLEPYLTMKEHTVRALMYSYGILWLIGASGILFVSRFARQQIFRQQRIEAALAAEKERLELVLEGAGVGLWDWNLQTDSVVFDVRWAKMLGYELAEIEPGLQSWRSRVHPDDLATCLRDIQSHIDGQKEYYSNIHRLRHKNGDWIHVLDRGRIVERDASGRPVRFSGTHTDITNLKEAENALREKTEILRHQASQLRLLNELLSRQAMFDGLTQIHNRRAFDKRFEEEWQHWRRTKSVFSILIADIDFFKKYNDTYGHQTGDDCLRAVALALQKTAVRVHDFTARYGGEEFIILLHNTEIDQAVQVAEKVRLAVEWLALPHSSSDCAKIVTLSVGVAAADQTAAADDSDALISLADQALYEAKNSGRNRTVRCARPPLRH
jgi:diguanylate cyclase (GGDEF)-like protein/PAS domain S-box-containing protein